MQEVLQAPAWAVALAGVQVVAAAMVVVPPESVIDAEAQVTLPGRNREKKKSISN